MVYVRVHVVKDHPSDEQKRQLGDKLVAAIAEVENLNYSERHQQPSWVQYFEMERPNWYGPSTIGDGNGFWVSDRGVWLRFSGQGGLPGIAGERRLRQHRRLSYPSIF